MKEDIKKVLILGSGALKIGERASSIIQAAKPEGD